jgi:AhpD family alkylhydroperoxidase
MNDHQHMYPRQTTELSRTRSALAPGIASAFREFSQQVFAAGALDPRTKQLIALATAHVTQCPYCIRAHVRGARREGATDQEIVEAIWVAAEMRAGGAVAHSVIALDELAAESGTAA